MNALASPQDVLDFWIGDADETSVLEARNKLWFGKSAETDAQIRFRFLTLTETLSAGPLAEAWSASGARTRLAAIIALDQFSRNLFRDGPRSFSQDMLARKLCKDGLTAGDDRDLKETEKIFFYLPLEHSEDPGDQARAVELYEALHRNARPGFLKLTKSTLDFARRHKDVIDRFGRFPHRNDMVARTSTAEEKLWLASNGGF
jgi:uncharacterized protein (DUF924 family)